MEHKQMKLHLTSSIPTYDPKELHLTQEALAVELNLEPGPHTFISEPMPIGAVTDSGQALQAKLVVPYEYLPEDGAVILSGSDYSGPERMQLVVEPASGGPAVLTISPQGPEANDVLAALWPKPQESWAISALFSASVRAASDLLIEDAQAQGLRVLVRQDMAPMPQEVAESLKVVYRNGCFYDFYQPDATYDADCQILPVSSVFGGTVIVPQNANFWNVIGSTHDPKHGQASWIAFWSAHTRLVPNLCSAFVRGVCNNNLIGGHIVFNVGQQRPAAGSNRVAAILPICTVHNARPNAAMTAAFRTVAVWLNAYFQ